MSRGRLVVHGHFYQPSRADPFSGEVPADPSAAPWHDWTARVSAESYRPNAERGNLGHMSWDLGPTLAAWMEDGDPIAYAGFLAGDRSVNGLGQPFHHTILPLASAADRRTEIRWGLRDFEWRFGRPAIGLWLPESAVDLPTLQMLADEGIQHTILAPWQAEGHPIDTRRPYRVDLGEGRSIVVAFYDGDLSSAVSFAPHATADADRFAQDIVEQRMAADTLPDDEPPLIVIATDGELYGHHQTFRELFLERLVQPRTDGDGPDFDVLPLASALSETEGRPFRFVTIAERTSWSCHHGVLRWTAECPCVPDGRWKGPLRSALERLAGAIDAVTVEVGAGFAGSPDVWAARDAYVDVVIGAEQAAAFAARWLGGGRGVAGSAGGAGQAGDAGSAGDAGAVVPDETARFLALMEAQRWRLAMFASDGWFWDDPMRPETAAVLRAAAHAARLTEGLMPSAVGLERRLVADLALLRSPGHHLDGAEIYRRALAEVGQPEPGDRPD